MKIDRAAFFAAVRASLFGGKLTEKQVAGMTVILDAAPAAFPLAFLAYCFATSFHETARTMQPIEEYGRGKGKSYGVPDKATGQTYFGRGLVQLTWLVNYQTAARAVGVDLVRNPALALQPDIAATIMFDGMRDGWFTGKKLGDYFSATTNDPTGARRIINGTDRASIIAGYHLSFEAALRAAGYGADPVAQPALQPDPKGEPIRQPDPPVLAPKPVPAATAPAKVSTASPQPAPSGGLFSALAARLRAAYPKAS